MNLTKISKINTIIYKLTKLGTKIKDFLNSPQKSELKLGEGEGGQEAAKVNGVLWWWSARFRRMQTVNRQTAEKG